MERPHMDDERIDFSALAPSAKRLEAMVAGALEQLPVQAPPSPWVSIARMRSAVLAMAALAALSWLPALTHSDDAASDTTQDPAMAMMQYSQSGDTLAMLEAAHGW